MLTVTGLRTAHELPGLQHEASGRCVFARHSNDTLVLNRAALKITGEIFREGPAYAKAGVLLFDLVSRNRRSQYALFPEVSPQEEERRVALMRALDAVNRKMGSGTVRPASTGVGDSPWRMRRERTSPRATTDWNELVKVRCG